MAKEILRKCVVCGEIKSRELMIKITKDATSKKIFINPDSKIFGRSVYLCYNQNCVEHAIRKNKINKALKLKLNIDKSVLERLLDIC